MAIKQLSVVTSGTVTCLDTGQNIELIHNNSAASLTISLPSTPQDLQEVSIYTVGGISALSVTGGTVINSSWNLDNTTKIIYKYYTDISSWVGTAFFNKSYIDSADSATLASANTYTDAKLEGLQAKQSCDVATTANITLSGIQTIDGISVIVGMRVLVKNQTTASENGIYVCAAGAWSRSTDMNVAAEFPSAYIPVNQGIVNADTQWKCTNDTVVVGTTAIVIVAVSVSGVELTANKGAANGYAPLGSDSRVPKANSYALTTPSPINAAIAAADDPQAVAEKLQGQINATISNLTVLNDATAKRRGKFANFNVIGFPSRGNQQSASNYSDGVITTETSKVYAKNIGNTTEMALYFTNFAYIGRNTATTQADYTIEASIEYPAGTITRVTFNNGSNTFLLKKGFGILSDFIKIYIPPNTPYAIRTNVLVNSGETWLRINYAYNSSVLGTEVVMQGVNLVSGGAMTGTANPFVYSPTAIVGLSNTRKASILLKGDSRSQGTGDSGAGAVDYGDHTLRGGLFGRALEDKFPILNCGLAGQRISHWAKGSSNQSIYYDEFLSMCQFCLTNLGINDLISGSTAAQVQALLILSWDSDLSHGLKTYQTTLEPVTTSTDGWVTEANQTIISWNAERLFVNAWLRDGAPIDKDTRAAIAVGTVNSQTVRVGDYRHPLKGVFDTAILVESTTTPGKWRAGFSIDGTHQNATGYAAGYVAIDTSVFAV